jgi:hypothetical protein
MTAFYWLRFETPPIWSARSPYLCPPGTGWPSYTPGPWVPFSSSSTTRRATRHPHGIRIWGFQILTAVKWWVLTWDVTPCSSLKVNDVPLLATCFHVDILFDLFFDPEDGGEMFPQKVGWLSTDYTILYRREQNSSKQIFFSCFRQPNV